MLPSFDGTLQWLSVSFRIEPKLLNTTMRQVHSVDRCAEDFSMLEQVGGPLSAAFPEWFTTLVMPEWVLKNETEFTR